jgi:Ca2+/H+ antiporter, TMEM165/GDT1 family
MFDWTIAFPTFLAAAVEWVEAFTIVLAASLSIGWRAASGAAAAALALLALMTAATGGAVRLGLALGRLQTAIGVFLLLFGVRWLAKAVARRAGLQARHDEAAEFADARSRIAAGDRRAAWLIAFKGVLLEGLEVWLIVVALGASGAWTSSVGAAVAALVLVAIVGSWVQAPLRRVPENALKFAVGAMIVSFGTFWTLEGLGGAGVWPLGDWSLAGLVLFYLTGGMLLAAVLRRLATQEALS